MRLAAPTNRLFRRLLAALTLTVVLATACGGEFASSASDTVADASAPAAFESRGAEDSVAAMDDAEFEAIAEEAAAADAADAGDAAGAVTTGSTGVEANTQLVDLGRDIIYTADLNLASTNVSQATRDAVRTIEGLGGFLFSQETNGTTNTSHLVFKILPDQFATALERLGSIGSVRSQAVSADDVTSIVVDLQSRITTAEASVIRLRALIDEADEFEIIASLENQLLQRETTLEQLRGQLRSLQNQVDLATITVSIVRLTNHPDLDVTLTATAGHDGGQSCSLGGGRASLNAQTTDITLCLQLANGGDTTLVDLDLDESVLGVPFEDFAVIDGEIDRLESGAVVLLVAEIELDEPVESLRIVASAQAIDAEGESLTGDVRTTSRPLWITVPVADELPGFGQVLSGSWNAVKTIALLIAIALVAAAPFAATAVVLAPAAVWVWRRLPRPTPKAPKPFHMPPPPPAAPPSAPLTGPGQGTQGDAATETEETTVSA